MKRVLLCALTMAILCGFAAAQASLGTALQGAFSRVGSAVSGGSPASSTSRSASPAPSINRSTSPAPVKPKVIEIPGNATHSPKRNTTRIERARTAKPNPKTTFVLANGERFASDQYTIADGVLHANVNGEPRTVPISTLDMKTTLAVNHARGVELKVPKNSSEVFLAF